MRITLSVTAGPHQGRVFSFAEHDTFIVGRSERAHFQLSDKDTYFSRFHFMVEVNPPHCRLMDMGSRNGTHVNGAKVKTADLKDGDEIKGGRTSLRVSLTAASPAQAQAPSGKVEAPAGAVQAPAAAARPAPPPKAPPPPPKPQVVPEPLPSSCSACGTAMGPSRSAPSAGPSAPSDSVICPSCRDLIEKQGQPIPGYLIVRELGRGAMGVVHLALRALDNSPIALKTIIPAVAGTRKQVDRFLREASILNELEHPNIVAFRDVGEATGGVLYFAMDYVKGTDAQQLLRKHGALPVRRAVNLVCQLLEGLAYAHAKKFVHRDVKPGNMLVTESAGREVVKLADFGLARVYQASQLSGLSLRGDMGGTMGFMPPDQIVHFREATPAADQYSAAATLYLLLTNQFIFDFPPNIGQQVGMILMNEPIPIRSPSRRPDIPAELADIIHRALAKDPRDRFPDVEALRNSLLKFG